MHRMAIHWGTACPGEDRNKSAAVLVDSYQDHFSAIRMHTRCEYCWFYPVAPSTSEDATMPDAGGPAAASSSNSTIARRSRANSS